jgi:N-formylglutamate amidohydrolase
MHALKSLTYFKEVDTAQWPLMIKEKELSWKEVKTRIEAKFKTFHSSLPGNKGDYR